VTSVLRVELFFDEEAGNWHYRVPALHINGAPRDYDIDAETLTLDVNVAPAALLPAPSERSTFCPRHERTWTVLALRAPV
jgi:hypothetical protein